MRQTAARLNRTWLIIIGLLLLLGGLVALLIGTGLLQTLGASAGMTIDRPNPDNHLVGPATKNLFGFTLIVVVVGLLGLLLAVLGLLWLIAQLPRTNEAKPFRLHDNAEHGLTRCAPSVITHAVEDQIKALPGVSSASAVLRGTAQQPDLTLKVTTSERSNIPRLLDTLHNQIATDVGTALDTTVAKLGVQIEISRDKVKTDRITI